MRTITIEVRSVYGQNKAYPVCADAHLFAQMLRTKTLTLEALKDIIALGYTIEARASCPGFTAAIRIERACDLPAVQ